MGYTRILTIILCLFAVTAGADECKCKDIGNDIFKCEEGCFGLMNNKSKRQEYIEKCDKYLDKAKDKKCSGEKICYDTVSYDNKALYAQIATAYCTRALLEKE